MRSYLGNSTLKDRLLVEIGKHEAIDGAIAQGLYGEIVANAVGFRGCAIGCSLHSLCVLNGHTDVNITAIKDHSRYPDELGIPIELAYLEDHIFENLAPEQARTWPRRFAEAVPVNADLSLILPQLMHWILTDATYGWITLADTDEQRAIFHRFDQLITKDWNPSTLDSVTTQEWSDIDLELETIPAWARAGAGAWAWARARVWAGAGARAGARVWARAGAERQYYMALADKTLELLRAAK